jgi:hypothetical protein
VLAVVFLGAVACSSGSPSKQPGTGGQSNHHNTNGGTSKLKRVKGNGGIKNVFAKTSSGDKVSLYAAAPGHEVMEQILNTSTKSWSAPISVFKDDTRFCHRIKLKSKGPVLAATVVCSISAKDVNGAQSSYVLASTDGKTWKRADLPGASGKPSVSPSGRYVAWTSPLSFLLWSPTGGAFTTVKYTQSATTPAVGAMQDDGTLLIIKATSEKHGFCVISFQQASAQSPTPRAIDSTDPQPDHPHCMITSAKTQPTGVIANLTQTMLTTVNGKKSVRTTTFAYSLRKLPRNGNWYIKL